MQSTLRLAYFAGHLVKVWFSQAHVLFWINVSCAEESFVFFRRRKSFTIEENHFKHLRRLCKMVPTKAPRTLPLE